MRTMVRSTASTWDLGKAEPASGTAVTPLTTMVVTFPIVPKCNLQVTLGSGVSGHQNVTHGLLFAPGPPFTGTCAFRLSAIADSPAARSECTIVHPTAGAPLHYHRTSAARIYALRPNPWAASSWWLPRWISMLTTGRQSSRPMRAAKRGLVEVSGGFMMGLCVSMFGT